MFTFYENVVSVFQQPSLLVQGPLQVPCLYVQNETYTQTFTIYVRRCNQAGHEPLEVSTATTVLEIKNMLHASTLCYPAERQWLEFGGHLLLEQSTI